MQIPQRLPGLRWWVALWAVTAVLWSMLEGDIRLVVLFGVWTTITAAAVLYQRLLGGRRLAALPGVLLMGLAGAALGGGSVLMILFLMAMKTGLHGHGPEFSAADVAGVGQQFLPWSLVGLLAGLGTGLLLLARGLEQ